MLIDAAIASAAQRVAQRADDVKSAYTPGAMPVFGDVATDRSSNVVALDPLSVAAPPETYFVTHDARGRTLYTRDGGFAVHDGALVGAGGEAVQGFTAPAAPLGDLRFDAVDAALGRVRDVRIERDGAVVYTRAAIDPRSGAREDERVVVGHVALARFAAATKLSAIDANHFAANAGSPPHVGRPDDGNFGSLEPMRRERSRVDIDESLVRLKDAYLAFDAVEAAQRLRVGLGKTAMDLLK